MEDSRTLRIVLGFGGSGDIAGEELESVTEAEETVVARERRVGKGLLSSGEESPRGSLDSGTSLIEVGSTAVLWVGCWPREDWLDFGRPLAAAAQDNSVDRLARKAAS